MSAAKVSAVSTMPSAAWKRVPAAGMSPADKAVEPDGTASRSITHRLDPGLAGGERGGEPGGARADDQDRNLAVEVDIVGGLKRSFGHARIRCLPGEMLAAVDRQRHAGHAAGAGKIDHGRGDLLRAGPRPSGTAAAWRANPPPAGAGSAPSARAPPR